MPGDALRFRLPEKASMLNFPHEGILISSEQDQLPAQGKGILFKWRSMTHVESASVSGRRSFAGR